MGDKLKDLLIIADIKLKWIKRFREVRQFANVKESTIKRDIDRLKVFINYAYDVLNKEPDELEYDDFIQFFKYLQKDRNVSVSTEDKYYKLLSVFYKSLQLENTSEFIKFKNFCKEIGKFKRIEKRHFDEIEPNEMNEIINHIIKNGKERDAFLLRLLWDTGGRVSEILNLKIKDCDFKKGLFKLRNTKSNEDREVVCSKNTLKAFRKYYLPTLKNKSPNDYLFQNRVGNKLSYSYINLIFSEAVNALKLKGTIPQNKWITLHSIRHGRVVDLLNKGYSLDIVGNYVGHKDIKTTMIYAHTNNRKKKILKRIQDDIL